MRSLWKCTFYKSHQHMIFACPISLTKCNSVEMHVCREAPEESALWYQSAGFLCPLSLPQAHGDHHSDSKSSCHEFRYTKWTDIILNISRSCQSSLSELKTEGPLAFEVFKEIHRCIK